MRRSAWLLVFVLLIADGFGRQCYAETIIRGPYIQDVQKRSALIVWDTDQSTASVVKFRFSGRWKRAATSAQGTHHSLRLDNLRPGRVYRYRITSGRETLAGPHRFRTAPAQNSSRRIRVAVFGDSGSGDSNQLAVAGQISGWKPDIMLHTGDLIYPAGAQSGYDDRFFEPYERSLRRTAIFPAPGNHDVLNVEAFEDNFNLPAEASESGSERYYSFNYGSVHFVALDTNLPYGESDPQGIWLRRDLEGFPDTGLEWLIVYFHHPPVSSGRHGDTLGVQTGLMPLLESADVDLVLNGHDHDYERFTPLNFSGHGSSIPCIVTGGGGAELYEKENPHSQESIFASRHHFVGLNISRRAIRGVVTASDGGIIDRFTVSD